MPTHRCTRRLFALALLAGLGACTTTPADGDPTAAPPVRTTSPPTATEQATSASRRAEIVALDGEVSARAAHTATTLPDGRVLIAGGCVVDGCATGSASTFLVAADGGGWEEGPAMTERRSSHTATWTTPGVVLVGGFPGEGAGPTTSVDLVDPAGTSVMRLADLTLARGGHAAAPMSGDRVLVVGGWIGPRTYTDTVEIVDVAAGVVREAAPLPWAADALDALALGDGRLLVTGGQVRSGEGTASAAVYDPTADTWEPVGPMTTPRFKHLSVGLADGTVLVIGGTTDDRDRLTSTELFDPAIGEFTPGPDLSEPRYKLTGGAVLLDDGRVLVAGGGRTVEVVDVATGTATPVHAFRQRGSFATANQLGAGGVLVLGGYDDRIDLRRAAIVLTP